MHHTADFSRSNDELREEGMRSIDYAGADFRERAETNELILSRLDGGSRLDLSGHCLGYITLLKPDGEPGYTYHGAAGVDSGIDRGELIAILCHHQGTITAVL